MPARNFDFKLHTQSGSNAYFVNLDRPRPQQVPSKHTNLGQHKNFSPQSTNELLSAAAVIGGVAAAHSAHISRPWVDDFRTLVHKATNKHYLWFLATKKEHLEEEINKIQQEIQKIKTILQRPGYNFFKFVQQARHQHLQSRKHELEREVTEIKTEIKKQLPSTQLQHNA